jgi:hypothetical protein
MLLHCFKPLNRFSSAFLACAGEPSTVCFTSKGVYFMQVALLPPLSTWQNFYTILGSASATLTGLMFVVVTMIAGGRLNQQSPGSGIAAFSSPNVVHFCVVLLIAATLNMPWPVLWLAGLMLGIVGLGGEVYTFVIFLRMRRQTAYEPVLEDWLWHIVFPFFSYTAIVVAAILLPLYPVPALFVNAAGTLLLLFSGIHNAWDTLTYTAVTIHNGLANKPRDE